MLLTIKWHPQTTVLVACSDFEITMCLLVETHSQPSLSGVNRLACKVFTVQNLLTKEFFAVEINLTSKGTLFFSMLL